MTDNAMPNDDLDTRRRRARFRAWHRGTKELDMVIGPFADAHLEHFDSDELAILEDVLLVEETELQRMIMGVDPIPDTPEGRLVQRIRTYQLERAPFMTRGQDD